MVANVELVDPNRINPNPDNPRLIFRLQELEELEASIATQGILVPLTVYPEGSKFTILDGERRWRCARKLGLHRVPVIIQPKPQRVQNIMMMFAIHNARRDWDPLPTALKLKELEQELQKAKGKTVTEAELAASASLSRGAVRRYRKILRIPSDIQNTLLSELQEAGSRQTITVDQVIEASDAAEDLQEAKVITPSEQRDLVDSIVDKFRRKVIRNTVEPRRIGAVARAVRRKQIPTASARNSILSFISQPDMTISELTARTIDDVEEHAAFDRGLRAFEEKWLPQLEGNRRIAAEFRDRVKALINRLSALL
jgi:ParB family transcriptional regulator, chromosome partitioning protein